MLLGRARNVLVQGLCARANQRIYERNQVADDIACPARWGRQ